MKSQNTLIYVFIGLIIALAIILFLLPKTEETPTPQKPQTGIPESVTTPPTATDAAPATAPAAENAQDAAEQQTVSNIVHLQALLDNETSQPEALKLATELSKSANEDECLAALRTFAWVGGKDSVNAILPMLKHNLETVAKEADNTLRHLIQQNLFEDSPLLDTNTWMEIFKLKDSNQSREEYLTLLTSFDVKDAVPVLIRLYDEGANAAKLASQYMEFVANGTTFSSKEEVETWFKNYLEDQENE